MQLRARSYENIICEGRCPYYDPGKERMKCGAYEFIERNLSLLELEKTEIGPETAPASPGLDGLIMDMACKRCEFLLGGCDYRSGLPAPPCGGYLVLAQLLGK